MYYSKNMKISNTAIDRIGETVRQNHHSVEFNAAIQKLNEWREAHGSILREYYRKCTRLAAIVDNENIIVAQRLKRLSTIMDKLNRFEDMRLSSMQDIAGVRIIVPDMQTLELVKKRLERWQHCFKVKDYIAVPKDSGYRSAHFVFKKKGLYVEIQLRTQLQHLWATSVETTDIFRGSCLKERDDNTYWHDFFCQVSSIFAIAEQMPVVPVYRGLGIQKISTILQQNMKRHRILEQITSFALTEPIIDNQKLRGAYYVVITLNSKKREAYVRGYKENQYHQAFENYAQCEQDSRHNQSVLIAVNKLRSLHDAYPNYFADLNLFLKIIDYILAKSRKIR